MVRGDEPFDTDLALKEVLLVRPQLKLFLDTFGSRTLSQYGADSISSEGSLSEAFKTVVQRKITHYFDSHSAERLNNALMHLCSVDTSGHGGVLSEDTLTQSHGVLSEGVRLKNQRAFLSLVCGVVPMNNSTWPRGFFLQGQRFSLLPKSFDRVAYHECPALTREHVEKKRKEVAPDSRARTILDHILALEGIFAKERFYQQVTSINHHLWNNVMRRGDQPEFFQLMLEAVTADLVASSIEKDDALSKLIFCEKNHEAFFELLSGLPGTWSLDRSKGTFLFWYASGDFRAASLWREKDSLTGAGIEIPFAPESIREALKARRIVPSVFLSLVSLLHHGVRPLGGYHQLWYLQEYKERLSSAANLIDDLRCPEFLSHIRCADLFHLGYGFAFMRDPDEDREFAGLDAFAKHTELPSVLWKKLHNISVEEAIRGNLRRWHSEIVRK